MTDKAAFRATYSDLRLVKGRKVLQLVFEVPLEESNGVLAALGGMPNPAAEVWCAIARLDLSVAGAARSAAGLSTADEKRETQRNPGGGHVAEPRLEPDREEDALDEPALRRPRKPVDPDKRLAQKSGILCGDPLFQKFLQTRLSPGSIIPYRADEDIRRPEILAAATVRFLCKVESRAELIPNTEAGLRWDLLESAFVAWRDVPEYADA